MGGGDARSRRTDARIAKRGRAPADGGEVDPSAPAGGGEADLGAPAVVRELDPGAPAVRGEVDPDVPVIIGEVEATGELISPAASAGAHKPVPSTSIIVQHASSAPVFSDESPVSRSLWVKLLSRPRGASNFKEQAATMAREIENIHSGSILSRYPQTVRRWHRFAL